MTKMSSLNYMELCRLCLVKEKVSVPIFEGEGGERQIFDKIATCLPVKVSQDDKLPKKICSDCVYRVENSYQFWNTTSNSEKQLLEWVVNDDVKVDTKSNLTMETEQLVLKEETIDHDQTAADVAKSLSRVEAVLTEETGQPGGGVSEEEEEEEDSDDGGGGGGGEDSNSEESGEEPPGKEEIESEEEEEEEEPYEELEPTTFVNVSLACDEAGPSGIQQTRQQTKQDSQASAASASATTENAEAPSTSAADPAASGWMTENYGDLTEQLRNISPDISSDHQSLLKHSRKSLVKDPQELTVRCKIAERKGSNYFKDPIIDQNSDPSKMTTRNQPNSLGVKKPHGTKGPLICDTCGKLFPSVKRLNMHRKIHTDIRYTCDICLKTYKSISMFYTHKKFHKSLKTYDCDVCDYRTPWKGNMNNHRRRHFGETKVTCDMCDKGFYNKCDLEEHKNIHTGNKPFKCDICESPFWSKRSLWDHKKAQHNSNLNEFKCTQCGKSFVFKSRLNRHLEAHQGKRFMCDVCGKSVTSDQSLKAHKTIHTDEKKFLCDVCSKAFNTTQSLKLHRRTHTGEKPYLCKECGKAFTQRSTLVVHARYHSGERPYICHLCSKGFVAKTHLNAHIEKHS